MCTWILHKLFSMSKCCDTKKQFLPPSYIVFCLGSSFHQSCELQAKVLFKTGPTFSVKLVSKIYLGSYFSIFVWGSRVVERFISDILKHLLLKFLVTGKKITLCKVEIFIQVMRSKCSIKNKYRLCCQNCVGIVILRI